MQCQWILSVPGSIPSRRPVFQQQLICQWTGKKGSFSSSKSPISKSRKSQLHAHDIYISSNSMLFFLLLSQDYKTSSLRSHI